MERLRDGNLEIVVAGPAGFGNNIYILIDHETGESAFIDAPGEPEKSIAAAEEAGVTPASILITHGHFDHTEGIAALRERFGCTVYAAADEITPDRGQADTVVAHGDTVAVGNLVLSAIHNPGHTPGSTSYVLNGHAFVGDTLFPGGPGRTRDNADLMQEIDSIVGRLHTLPADTVIYPGHGDRTTIGASQAEYAGFAARPHDPDLHGDVLWATS